MLYGVPQIQPAGGGHGAAASPAYALERRPVQAWTAVVTEITQFFFSSEMLRNCGILRQGRRRLFSPPRRSPPPHDAVPAASAYVSAGGVAGFVEALVVHPLDMIKTRWGCSEPRASIASHVHV